MLKKPRKSIAGIFILLSFLLFDYFAASAQSFAKLPSSDYDPDSYVDTLLPVDKSLGSLPVDNSNWDVRYYKLIESPTPTTDGNNRPVTRIEKDKKTAKTFKYRAYDSPYIYYAILDMPSGARFYGLVTTGYNDMETVMDKPKSDWHPYTQVQPVSGTIVDADGNQSSFFLYSDADWKKLKIAKPLGTYNIDGFRGYERVTLTFNQGGTGSMTLLPYVHTQSFITYSGGDLKQKMANGRTKKRVNVIMGGPHSWQITSKRNFKWTINDEGDLVITPTGAATIFPKDWVPVVQDNTLFLSKADSLHNRRQVEYDHKYVHDEIIEYNKNIKITTKERAEEFAPIVIWNPQITKKEIVGVEEVNLGTLVTRKDLAEGKYNGSRIYLGPKLDDEMKVAYVKRVYNKVPTLKENFKKKRVFGADLQYNKWQDRTKILVIKNKDVFGSNPDYTVLSPSVKGKRASIVFYNNGKRCYADMYFDGDGQIDLNKLKQSITFDNEIEENNAKIADLNSKIMEYKKDKRRGKIVKDYEKRFKKVVIPSSFSNSSEFFNILDQQKKLIKDQEETLSALQ